MVAFPKKTMGADRKPAAKEKVEALAEEADPSWSKDEAEGWTKYARSHPDATPAVKAAWIGAYRKVVLAEEKKTAKAAKTAATRTIIWPGDKAASASKVEKAAADPSVTHTRPLSREDAFLLSVGGQREIGGRIAELLEEVSENPARRRELLALTTNYTCALIEEGSLPHDDLVECLANKNKKQQTTNNFVVNQALGFVDGNEEDHEWTAAAPQTETARKNLAHLLKKTQRAAVAITDMGATRKIHEGALVIDGAGVAERFGKTPVLLDGSRTKDSKVSHSVEQCAKFAAEDHGPKETPEPTMSPWVQVYIMLARLKERGKITEGERGVAAAISDLLATILELPEDMSPGLSPVSLVIPDDVLAAPSSVTPMPAEGQS